MNKKAFFFIPLTVGIVLALALLVAVIFGGSAFLTWILAKSVFYLSGIVVLLAGMFLAFKGKIMPVWLWFLGGLLVVTPYIFNSLKGVTLSMILG